MLGPLLASALGPALVAGLLLLAPLLWHRLRGGRLAGAPFGALGLGLAYLACHPLVRGKLPGLPPAEATDWPWFLAPAALALALLELRWGRIPPVRWSARLAVLGGGLFAIGRLLPGFHAGSAGWVTTCLALGLGIVLLAGLDGLADRDAEPPSLLALVATCAGAAGVMVVGNSAALGQLCGVLAAALGAQLALAWWQPALTPLRGAAPVLGLILANLVFTAHLFGYPELPAASCALLALAPGAAWASRAGPLGRLPGWASLGLALAAVGLLCGGAAWLAHTPADDGYMPY